MRFCHFVASSIIAFVVIASHTAEASPVIFTDRANFQAYYALQGLEPLTLETFSAPVWDINIVADACTMHVPGLSILHDCHDGAVDFSGIVSGQFFGDARFSNNHGPMGGTFDLPQVAVGFDYSASSSCFGFPLVERVRGQGTGRSLQRRLAWSSASYTEIGNASVLRAC